MGLAARGAIPFPSTFACFLTRAADFIRMAAISERRHQARRLARGRVDRRGRPVADGARGPRHDARAARLRPSSIRATPSSAERLVGAGRVPPRPRVHADEPAEDAGDLRRRRDVPDRRLKVLRQSDRGRGDGRWPPGSRSSRRSPAYDALKADGIAIRVIDAVFACSRSTRATLIARGRATGGRLVTVEDHYAAGGIGDAVAEAVAPSRPHRAPARGPRDPAQRQARRAARAVRHFGGADPERRCRPQGDRRRPACLTFTDPAVRRASTGGRPARIARAGAFLPEPGDPQCTLSCAGAA